MSALRMRLAEGPGAYLFDSLFYILMRLGLMFDIIVE